MPPVTEMALVVGPREPQTKRGFPGAEWRAQAPRAMEAARRLSSIRAVRQAVLAQHQGRAAEGVGLHDVAAHREIGLVDAVHHVGPGGAEVLVAPFEIGTAEVVRRQCDALQSRARGAVEHQDALGQGGDQKGGALVRIGGALGKRYVEDRVAHSLSSLRAIDR